MTEILFDTERTDYSDKRFTDLECSKKVIQNIQFENCHFKNCNFDDASFLHCKFIECDFTHCSLNAAILTGTSFSDVNFDHSQLMNINWIQAKWPQIKLFSTIGFVNCDISHSNFFGLGLSEINLQECRAHNVDFREADLAYGNLTDSDFYCSLFSQTKLVSADFSGAINYNIDMMLNDVKKATFSFPEVVRLLDHFEIQIKDFP